MLRLMGEIDSMELQWGLLMLPQLLQLLTLMQMSQQLKQLRLLDAPDSVACEHALLRFSA